MADRVIWAIVVLLALLWLLGLVSSHTVSWSVHLLLVAAIVVLAVNLVARRKVR